MFPTHKRCHRLVAGLCTVEILLTDEEVYMVLRFVGNEVVERPIIFDGTADRMK